MGSVSSRRSVATALCAGAVAAACLPKYYEESREVGVGGTGGHGGVLSTGGGGGTETGGSAGADGGHSGDFSPGGVAGGGGLATGNVCEGEDDCVDGATCFERICVGTGPLQFTLTWEGEGDLNLYVIEPDEDVIYWGTYSGESAYQADDPEGILDVDDCTYEQWREPPYACRSEGTHVENIFFSAPTHGEYAVCVDGFYTAGQSVDFTITATIDGVVQTPETGAVDDDWAAGTSVSEHYHYTYGS